MISRPFVKYWIAATTTSFGTAVTDVAVPLLAVLTFHASALLVAGLLAIEQVSWLLIGLPAGVWVDRWSRRMVLVSCDLGRAALISSIPVAALLGILTSTQLFIGQSATYSPQPPSDHDDECLGRWSDLRVRARGDVPAIPRALAGGDALGWSR
jgi:MFS family permease